jgi:hypothetical protein
MNLSEKLNLLFIPTKQISEKHVFFINDVFEIIEKIHQEKLIVIGVKPYT